MLHPINAARVEEPEYNNFQVRLFGAQIGPCFPADRGGAQVVANWLNASWRDLLARANGVDGWETKKAEPDSIAVDLKTPPAGAVEGAEILPRLPVVGGRCQVRSFYRHFLDDNWNNATRERDEGGQLMFRTDGGSTIFVLREKADGFVRLIPERAQGDLDVRAAAREDIRIAVESAMLPIIRPLLDAVLRIATSLGRDE